MKKPKVSQKYREWLKQQPCCNPSCKGRGGQTVVAHQRILGRCGVGIKPPDADALPLCFFCHSLEHRGSITFWEQGNKAKTKRYVQGLCDYQLEKYKRFKLGPS